MTKMENASLETIQRTLKSMKKEIKVIKEHMVDADSIMTEDDYAALQDYRRDKKKGELTSHKDLKKQLGL